MKWTMRALCLAMALSLVVAVPVLATREEPFEPVYVQSYTQDESGSYVFEVTGGAYLAEYDYTQELAYTVTIAPETGRVSTIVPVRQSTMGYEAYLEFFVGKTEAENAGLTDLTDPEERPRTALRRDGHDTALRAMVLECFEVMERAEAGNGRAKKRAIFQSIGVLAVIALVCGVLLGAVNAADVGGPAHGGVCEIRRRYGAFLYRPRRGRHRGARDRLHRHGQLKRAHAHGHGGDRILRALPTTAPCTPSASRVRAATAATCRCTSTSARHDL